jgi:hypothetical protein
MKPHRHLDHAESEGAGDDEYLNVERESIHLRARENGVRGLGGERLDARLRVADAVEIEQAGQR